MSTPGRKARQPTSKGGGPPTTGGTSPVRRGGGRGPHRYYLRSSSSQSGKAVTPPPPSSARRVSPPPVTPSRGGGAEAVDTHSKEDEPHPLSTEIKPRPGDAKPGWAEVFSHASSHRCQSGPAPDHTSDRNSDRDRTSDRDRAPDRGHAPNHAHPPAITPSATRISYARPLSQLPPQAVQVLPAHVQQEVHHRQKRESPPDSAQHQL